MSDAPVTYAAGKRGGLEQFTEQPFPVHLSALDEEHLDGRVSVSERDERWPNVPEADLLVVGDVLAQMARHRHLAESIEGIFDGVEHTVGDLLAEALLDVV